MDNNDAVKTGEFVDSEVCYTPGSIDLLKSRGVQRLSWARVVWVDRNASPSGCANLVDTWVVRPCEGNENAWRHNHLYVVRDTNGIGLGSVKVGDLRDCSDDMTAPEDSL